MNDLLAKEIARLKREVAERVNAASLAEPGKCSASENTSDLTGRAWIGTERIEQFTDAALSEFGEFVIKQAAEVVHSECERILATQSGKKDEFNQSVDMNTRMLACVLPDIGNAILSLGKITGTTEITITASRGGTTMASGAAWLSNKPTQAAILSMSVKSEKVKP